MIFPTLVPVSVKTATKIPPSVALTESISTVSKSEKSVSPQQQNQKNSRGPTQIPFKDCQLEHLSAFVWPQAFRGRPSDVLEITAEYPRALCGHNPFEDVPRMCSKTSSGWPPGPTSMATMGHEQRATQGCQILDCRCAQKLEKCFEGFPAQD